MSITGEEPRVVVGGWLVCVSFAAPLMCWLCTALLHHGSDSNSPYPYTSLVLLHSVLPTISPTVTIRHTSHRSPTQHPAIPSTAKISKCFMYITGPAGHWLCIFFQHRLSRFGSECASEAFH